MSKRAKVILIFAVTLAIGMTAVIGNSYLVSMVMAADAEQKMPVIADDKVPGGEPSVNTVEEQGHIALLQGPDSPKIVVQAGKDGSLANVHSTQIIENIVLKEFGKGLEDLTEAENIALRNILREIAPENESGNKLFVPGTPSDVDLAEEEAVKIAQNAVVEKFALTDDTLSRFSVHAAFNVVNPDQPVWCVTLFPTKQEDFAEIGNYYIVLNSQSGEIVQILSAADGIG